VVDDVYQTPWYGRHHDREEALGGDGRPVIGLFARQNERNELVALGLIVTGRAPK